MGSQRTGKGSRDGGGGAGRGPGMGNWKGAGMGDWKGSQRKKVCTETLIMEHSEIKPNCIVR